MASKTKKVWTNDVIEELIEMVEASSVIWNYQSFSDDWSKKRREFNVCKE
jgi:hypothetical protein